MKYNTNSLVHTMYNCKYDIVFAPKYRRMAFYGSKRLEIGNILRKLCEWKGVNIIETEVCVDHIHMLKEDEEMVQMTIDFKEDPFKDSK